MHLNLILQHREALEMLETTVHVFKTQGPGHEGSASGDLSALSTGCSGRKREGVTLGHSMPHVMMVMP